MSVRQQQQAEAQNARISTVALGTASPSSSSPSLESPRLEKKKKQHKMIKVPRRTLVIGEDTIQVSSIGLGTSSFGGCFSPDVAYENAETVTLRALEAGINWIDSAPWYGDGLAESRVGEVLRRHNIPRESYYIATKVGRYKPQITEMFDFSYERTLKSIDESLARLGCDYIDLIQIHDPEYAFPNTDIIIYETLPALLKAKEQGKVRWIGLTGYPFWVQKQILERSLVKIDICMFYCHYGLHDTSLITSMKPYLDKLNIPFIHASPFGMGLLTNQGPPTWHPATKKTRALCAEAAEYCRSKNVDISKLALYFALKEKSIPTTIFSTPNLEEFEKNLAIAAEDFKLTEHEEEVLCFIRQNFFSQDQSWDGIEPAKYFRKLKSSKAPLS